MQAPLPTPPRRPRLGVPNEALSLAPPSPGGPAPRPPPPPPPDPVPAFPELNGRRDVSQPVEGPTSRLPALR